MSRKKHENTTNSGFNASNDYIFLGCVYFTYENCALSVTGKVAGNVNPISIGVLQLGFVGVFSTILSLIMETPKLPDNPETWFSTLVLSIFCTGIPFIVQIIAQQYTTPTHAGLIFTLEPVFSSGFAFIFTGETLSNIGYLGAILLLISVLIAELDFKSLLKVNYRKNIE